MEICNSDSQYYFKDSLIGAPEIPEKVLSNGFINFVYDKDNFSAGVRYESYLDPISGFDNQYQGIANSISLSHL